MKTFRTYEQAKKDLQVIHNYVKLIEEYQQTNFLQTVIYTYALLGNIVKTAEELNKMGYRISNKEIKASDVTDIIKSKPAKNDELHDTIRSLYFKKTRAARKTIEPFF